MTQPIVIAIAGGDKATKTSTGLTFPKPLRVLETDIATVSRAISRFKGEDIKVTPFPTPVGWGKTTDRDIKAVWIAFLEEYKRFLEDKLVVSIQIDTSTKLWWICHSAYLQELNEKAKVQGKNSRERLQEIEYGEPNNRMASIIYAARAYNKNLILIHHVRPEYQQVMMDGQVKSMEIPGTHVLDGFKYTKSLVDLEVRVTVETIEKLGRKPVGEIILSGLALEMEGQKIIEPSYDKIIQMVKIWRPDW